MEKLKTLLLPFMSLFLLFTCKKPPNEGTNSDYLAQKKAYIHLAQNISERLSHMKNVAAYKWDHQLPIEDLEREKIVLQNSVEEASQYGLKATSTQEFFQLQIELAKDIQHHWFHHWETNGFDHNAYPDLQQAIRPQLISLGDSIVKGLANIQNWPPPTDSLTSMQATFKQRINIEGIPSSAGDTIFWSVVRIR